MTLLTKIGLGQSFEKKFIDVPVPNIGKIQTPPIEDLKIRVRPLTIADKITLAGENKKIEERSDLSKSEKIYYYNVIQLMLCMVDNDDVPLFNLNDLDYAAKYLNESGHFVELNDAQLKLNQALIDESENLESSKKNS